jgi:transcription-repair coupling factor (superfamily II helicase)
LTFKRWAEMSTLKDKRSLESDFEKSLFLKGLSSSSRSLFAASCIEQTGGVHWFIFSDREEAAYFSNDLSHALDEESVMFFPSAYKRSISQNEIDEAGLILRTAVLNRLKNIQKNSDKLIVVTFPEALMEKVLTSESLNKNTLELKVGEKISIGFIREVLEEYHFEEVEFIYEPGQFSVRGSIVDIFSYSHHLPYRVDFFGDEVESIRTFEIEDQLSREKLNIITIVPNIQKLVNKDNGDCVLNLLPQKTLIWSENLKLSIERIKEVYKNAPEKIESEPSDKKILRDQILSKAEEVESLLDNFRHIEFGQVYMFHKSAVVEFATAPQPTFNKNFELLSQNLYEHEQKGYKLYLLSENPKQIERLKDILNSLPEHVIFYPIVNSIHEGFIDHHLKICLYTDHQIFERYHKYRINRQFIRSEVITLNELRGLQKGDYIVHIDHGIGVFGGPVKTEINGRSQEAICLVYKDNDVLYVSIHNLHKISKYRGKEGEPPKIYKLGTSAWQNMKQTTKNKVKDIARELIALYAKRKASQGFAYSPDTYLQEELEASFIYEDTPDQLKATKSVKEGMEVPHPMDHLICGDVGFGKTEVAIRAAFKAVTDSKQVAVLVPTTILALQHYNTFKERLEKFPCTVDYISRLKSAKNQKETLKKLETGQVDIIIGTHRLVGKDVKFKDLGLLVIDEEQKFGVAVKEKLKRLRVNVDTLTMTATPIPRTLQFSLMGARDLSIINTPPPNRHPIQTELHIFNEKVIQDAVEFEVERNGQVFFIHIAY